VKFKVINETEQRASALSVKVVRRFSHNTSTRHLRYDLSDCLPGFCRSYSNLKRCNLMCVVIRIA